jgi:hypothetical protein
MMTSTADAGGLVARAAGGSSLNGGEKLPYFGWKAQHFFLAGVRNNFQR